MSVVRPKSWNTLPERLYSDPVFFHKTQVRQGVHFRCYGRTKPGSLWSVQQIWTTTTRNGVVVSRSQVLVAQKLSDRVKLINFVTGEVLNLSFKYISYSAIWRLEN